MFESTDRDEQEKNYNTEKSGFQPFPRKYVAKPLSFNPQSLHGLSEKLIQSHHDVNYGGYIKHLAKIEEEIIKLTPETPPFIWTDLKHREHYFRNAIIMHEMYFENIGGKGKIDGQVKNLVSSAWGSLQRFEVEFKMSGNGIGGNAGWIILNFDLKNQGPVISVLGPMDQFAINSVPLLLMDVYEHAYAIDYGADLKGYIEAFFRNINWEVVNKRLEIAKQISNTLSLHWTKQKEPAFSLS